MTRIIRNNGDVEYVSPGEAHRIVAEGEAVFDRPTPMYTTRQMTAEKPKAKAKRKRRAKKEKEVVAETQDEETVTDESESV